MVIYRNIYIYILTFLSLYIFIIIYKERKVNIFLILQINENMNGTIDKINKMHKVVIEVNSNADKNGKFLLSH